MKEKSQSSVPLSLGETQGKSKVKFSSDIDLSTMGANKGTNAAGTQEREVCSLLRKNPTGKFTKTEIWNELVKTGKIEKRTPESSISRALSNLRDRALVLKLREKKMGSFGRKITLWKIEDTASLGTQTDLFKP